jgi:hypothetical protein
VTASQDSDPNQWTVLIDYLKTTITLAAGLLGVTVTFAGQILASAPSLFQRVSLATSWAFLLACILCAVLGVALTVHVLRHGTRQAGSVLFSNLAFFLLLAASAALLAVGLSRLTVPQQSTLGAAIGVAREALEAADASAAGWSLSSALRTERGQLRIRFGNPSRSIQYLVVVEAANLDISEITRVEEGGVSDAPANTR